MWSDLNGVTHGRYIPAARIEGHTHHAITTLTMGIDGVILPVEGYAADVGYPDLRATPVLATRRPGWEPDTDVVICELSRSGGEPLPICPRRALERAIDGWRAIGWEPQLGIELEFYVLEERDGAWVPATQPGALVYGVGLGGDGTGLALEYFDIAEAMDLDLEGVLSEFSPAQLELNMVYGPALDAVDRAVVCREMSREVAARRGYRATYMGRPSPVAVGSGMHLNFSVLPADGGTNGLFDAADPEGLSTLARHAIGGLIAHHEAVTGLSAPLVNSYKRLMPGLIAGYWANWGLDNRISTYRIPAERGAATRIENRAPCASASPYLSAAAMLNAALLGVAGGTECGDPQFGDADAEPNTDRHTPHTLTDALDAVEADADLIEAMGDDLVRTYVTLRRYDAERWSSSGEEWDPERITEWELDTYLPFY